jgi:uncharacterized membrane protein
MKLLGHPLHPALVHFPIACWGLTVLSDGAAYFLGFGEWWRFSGMLNAAGVAFALPAMVAGMADLAALGDRPEPVKIAYRHMGLMGTAWLFFSASLYLRMGEGGFLEVPGMAAVWSSLAGFLLTAWGGWCGAELVYRYKMGVVSPEKPFKNGNNRGAPGQ